MIQSIRERFVGLRDSLAGRVIINTGWLTAATPVTITLGVVQTALMARMVGLEGVGIIGLFVAVVSLLSSFSNASSAETLITFTNRDLAGNNRKDAARVILYCHVFDVVTSCLAYFVLLAFAGIVASLFHIPEQYGYLLTIYCLTLVLSAAYWDSNAVLRVTNRFRWIFYQNVFHSLFKTVLLVVLYFMNQGLEAIIWLNVAMAFLDGISMAILSLIALDKRGITPGALIKIGPFVPKDVWHFQWLGYGRGILKSLNRYVDTLLIGYLTTPSEVGLYRVSIQLANLIKMPTQGFSSSIYPEYSRLWFAKQYKTLRHLVRRFTLLFVLGGVGVAILFWVFIDQIILVVLGAEFLPARQSALILMWSAVMVVAAIPLYALPAAVGRGRPALMAVGIALAAQVITILIFVPSFGVIGAAWANVVYVLIWLLALTPAIVSILKQPASRTGEAGIVE